MLFPVHLHTVHSLWSTMWSEIHMLCSLLTSRAITAQSPTLLSGMFFLQNWSWGYCQGCLAPGYSHSPTCFLFTAKWSIFTLTCTHSTNISSAVCIHTQKKKSSDKAFYKQQKKIMHSDKQKQAWQTTLFLSSELQFFLSNISFLT